MAILRRFLVLVILLGLVLASGSLLAPQAAAPTPAPTPSDAPVRLPAPTLAALATTGGIAAYPTTVAANGIASSPITVTLRNANGQGVSGKVVTLSQATGHSLVTGQNPITTDANGNVTFKVTDTKTESVTYTAVDVTDGNLPVPGSAAVRFTNGSASSCSNGTPTASPGYAFASFATGFDAGGSCTGPAGVIFDAAGNLYVTNSATGFLYKFGPQGGIADATTQLNTTPITGTPVGLTFGKDGKLYLARPSGNDVLELDPATGAIVRTVASGLCVPLGLATDPLSGDLFVTQNCSANMMRIANPASATPTVTVYASPGTGDGLAVAPNGTFYAASVSTVVQVAGTTAPTPGAVTVVASVPNPDGIVVGIKAGVPAFLFVNRTDGIITKVDLGTNPATTSDVFTGGTRGDHAAVGPDGCVYATQTDRVIRVTNPNGICRYSVSNASDLQYYPLSKPVRLLDTRAGATAFVHPNTALTAGQTLALPGQFSYQSVTIPPSAQAIVGNATVANDKNATPAGFATLFPTGVPLPLASNLNFVPGTVRPNAFTVALGGDGKFNLYSSTGGDFVVDISGYYAPVAPGGLYFHPLSAPVRELDTRSGATAFVHPNATLTAGQTLTLPGSFTFAGITVPASAKALVGNATVANDANSTPAGFATLFPDDVPLPLASNLNFVPGTVAPNAFTVAMGGGDGKYNLYSSTGGDFVIDITGYLDTVAAGGLLFTPLSAPVRELDTRSGATAFVHPNATLTAGQTLTLPGSFTFAGITVPASAKALVGNATVANDANSTPAGFATLFPDGVTLPLASNLNFVTKQVAPNAIVVGVGGDGKYALYTSSGGDFVIDISGYFS